MLRSLLLAACFVFGFCNLARAELYIQGGQQYTHAVTEVTNQNGTFQYLRVECPVWCDGPVWWSVELIGVTSGAEFIPDNSSGSFPGTSQWEDFESNLMEFAVPTGDYYLVTEFIDLATGQTLSNSKVVTFTLP